MEQSIIITNPKTNEQYTLGKKLGQGAYGEVYKVTDNKGHIYAMKILSKYNQKIIDSETGSLKDLSSHLNCHPDIACYYDSFEFSSNGEKYYAILTEFIDGMDLLKYASHTKLNTNDVLIIGIWLLTVIKFLHENGYVHRDIAPRNIMRLPSGHLKLIDFGISCREEDNIDSITPVCTRSRGVMGMIASNMFNPYVLPPKDLFEAYKAADIFSIGVTLYELIKNRFPYKWERDNYGHRVITSDYYPLNTDNPCLDEAIRQMVSKNPYSRPTAGEALEILLMCQNY